LMPTMPNVSPEVWAIIVGVLVIWFAIAGAVERIDRIGQTLADLKNEVSLVEMHLRHAPWVEARESRNAHYWTGDAS
jgi:hypothetical protein